jgi:hypothetical protein
VVQGTHSGFRAGPFEPVDKAAFHFGGRRKAGSGHLGARLSIDSPDHIDGRDADSVCLLLCPPDRRGEVFDIGVVPDHQARLVLADLDDVSLVLLSANTDPPVAVGGLCTRG